MKLSVYVAQVLAAFGNEPAHSEKLLLAEQSKITNPKSCRATGDRERDVLRLLDTELNGPEMAHKLMVSLNPLRTHTKNIYTKLGVNNRQAAIRRAAELNLL